MINIRNRVQLIGPVSKVQAHETLNGVVFSTFHITTTETFTTKDGEKQTELVHHPCIAYGKEAVIVRDRIRPGDNIAVEGRLIQMPSTSGGNTNVETLVYVKDLLRLH